MRIGQKVIWSNHHTDQNGAVRVRDSEKFITWVSKDRAAFRVSHCLTTFAVLKEDSALARPRTTKSGVSETIVIHVLAL